MHSLRNTELSTTRAAGLRPKEMFDNPRVVCTSGNRRLTSRIASMVSMPSRRVSSCPVAIGKVRQSMMMSLSRSPQFWVMSVMIRSATCTFQSAVRACPCSSIVSAITAAPCSWTRLMILVNRESGPSPSS